MKFIDRAWNLQYRIENKFKKIPSLSFVTYCQFLGLSLVFVGIGIFLYCLICNINFFILYDLYNPLLYFTLGFMFSVFFIVKKIEINRKVKKNA